MLRYLVFMVFFFLFFHVLQQIGGQEIKVTITEKPLPQVDLSLLQAEDSQFVDSPHKVYVGNLPKTVTSETLKKFFSEKGKVMSAKVSRVPGSSKSGGFGFVSFSLDEEVEAAISSFNNAAFSLSHKHSLVANLEKRKQNLNIGWWETKKA